MTHIAIDNAKSIKEARECVVNDFDRGNILKTSSKAGGLWVYFINKEGEHCISFFELIRKADVWHFVETPDYEIKDNFTCPLSIVRAAIKNSPKSDQDSNPWRNAMIAKDDAIKAHKKAVANLQAGDFVVFAGITYKLCEKVDRMCVYNFGRSKSVKGWRCHDIRNAVPIVLEAYHLENGVIIKNTD